MNYKKNNNKEEEYYRENILPKFSKVETVSVPEEIWQNIKTNIQQEPNKTNIFSWLNIFELRYAFTMVAVFVLLSISIFGAQEINMYKQVNHGLNSMLNYLSSDVSIIGEDIKL